MATVRLPTVLRPLADGAPRLEIRSATLAGLGAELRERYPELAERIYAEDGAFREFVSVFVDGTDARLLRDDVPLGEGSEVTLLPAISGG